MQRNFLFLKDTYPSLYESAYIGAKNAFEDSDTCIYKMRKLTEELVEMVLEKEGILTDQQRTHYENITTLAKLNIMEEEYIDYLHELRLTANATIHDRNANIELAKRCLWLAYKVCIWLYKRYNDPLYQEAAFQYRHYRQSIYDGLSHVSDEDKELFNRIMEFVAEHTLQLIAREKRDEMFCFCSTDIPELSFFEFYHYFNRTLENIANFDIENGTGLAMILKLRRIARHALMTNDDLATNKELALMIYSNTHWARNNNT